MTDSFVFLRVVRVWWWLFRFKPTAKEISAFFSSPLENERHKIFTKLTRKRFGARKSTRDREI